MSVESLVIIAKVGCATIALGLFVILFIHALFNGVLK